ncbi:PREDICTED: uncharacterized protein K02A2.6-like [Lupinus angustifolius]|uniref:uncharacterized protein K02A2.6-like n=1 Tax=Lupinus angustifolius TaxID=3871 RepID=UPI00092E8E1D|nr:PREDICTED: uncharacterized protein K02A2.6-like [Lupinus angustifolius]
MEKDAADLTRKCTRCQLFAGFHKAPLEELTTTQAPWPFYRWGMDILGPFPQATGQLKFLIVAIDYFTKWIEAEALATITSANIQKFSWRHIITRFGIPSAIVTDNGTQFADRRFQELLSGLRIKQHFTSVEHPQTNGQVDAANKVILKGHDPGRDRRTYLANTLVNEVDNQSLLRNNLDGVEEIWERARLRENVIKKKTATKFNSYRIKESIYRTGKGQAGTQLGRTLPYNQQDQQMGLQTSGFGRERHPKDLERR